MPYTLEIIQEEFNPESPREWDNCAKFALFHKRYNLPNEVGIDHSAYASWEEMETDLIKLHEAAAIRPVYMYDHSCITIKTSPFGCRWDSGQIGFAFIDRETILKEHPGRKKLSRELLAWADAMIESEVKTYGMYISGDVWGYVIKEEGGEVVDSCFGLYGEDRCRSEGEFALAQYVAEEPRQADLFEEAL